MDTLWKERNKLGTQSILVIQNFYLSPCVTQFLFISLFFLLMKSMKTRGLLFLNQILVMQSCLCFVLIFLNMKLWYFGLVMNILKSYFALGGCLHYCIFLMYTPFCMKFLSKYPSSFCHPFLSFRWHHLFAIVYHHGIFFIKISIMHCDVKNWHHYIVLSNKFIFL